MLDVFSKAGLVTCGCLLALGRVRAVSLVVVPSSLGVSSRLILLIMLSAWRGRGALAEVGNALDRVKQGGEFVGCIIDFSIMALSLARFHHAS